MADKNDLFKIGDKVRLNDPYFSESNKGRVGIPEVIMTVTHTTVITSKNIRHVGHRQWVWTKEHPILLAENFTIR